MRFYLLFWLILEHTAILLTVLDCKDTKQFRNKKEIGEIISLADSYFGLLRSMVSLVGLVIPELPDKLARPDLLAIPAEILLQKY